MNYGDEVLFEIDDSIGILTLNHPPENYLTVPEFIPVTIFREWTNNDTLKGLIIKGEGKNFSAGGNLEHIFSAGEKGLSLHNLMADGLELLRCIQNLDIPVIAAINRVCFGGGLEIALACHFRVASENALLAFPEVNRNLMPGMGGTFRLPATISLFESTQMILGGDMINATEAKELGILDYVAPKDKAFEFSWNLMQKMTHDRPVKVIRFIMRALKNSTELSPEEAMKEETNLFCELARDESIRRKKEDGHTVDC